MKITVKTPKALSQLMIEKMEREERGNPCSMEPGGGEIIIN